MLSPKSTVTSQSKFQESSMIQSSVAAKSLDVNDLKEKIRQLKLLESLSKDESLKLRLQHVGPSVTLWFKENPLKIVKGSGQYLYDELGNEYLDCINNVAHVGHGNQRVQEAVNRQLGLINTNSRFLHDNLSLYAKRLTAQFPPHLSVCYLVNSGSEANDLAIRLARAYTSRKDIVSVDGAYHGNLTSTMAISPYKNEHIVNFKQAKWAHIAPLPCAYRGMYASAKCNLEDETLACLYVDETQKVFEEAKSKGRQVAAFIVESMISCGGQTPLPEGYLRKMQNFLHKEGSLLICDEVQTGFGRSGKRMWAFQLQGDDVKPDIVTVGKPMGNGFPVSAVVTTREIASSFMNIGTEYFNTFGGNAASCAAAMAVLDEIESRGLVENANIVGSYILQQVKQLKKNSRIIGDVRGVGFFIGIDIVDSTETRRASQEYAQYIVQRFRDHKVLMSTEGKLGNVLKFKPPMVFSLDNAIKFVQILTKAVQELEAQIDRQVEGGEKEEEPQVATKVATGAIASPASSSGSSSGRLSQSSSSSMSSNSSWLESSSEM